jgi:hypothetical protein
MPYPALGGACFGFCIMLTTRRILSAAVRRTGLRSVPGHFDGLAGSSLAGWAQGTPTSASVTLFFGDEVVGRVRGTVERRDVLAAGESGMGFQVPVSRLARTLENLQMQDDDLRSLKVVDDAGRTLPPAGEPATPAQLQLLLALGLALNALGAPIGSLD